MCLNICEKLIAITSGSALSTAAAVAIVTELPISSTEHHHIHLQHIHQKQRKLRLQALLQQNHQICQHRCYIFRVRC